VNASKYSNHYVFTEYCEENMSENQNGNSASRKIQNSLYPMHRLKQVEKPTNLITDDVKQIDAREEAFNKGNRGDYGAAVQNEMPRLLKKDAINAAQVEVLRHLAAIKDNPVDEKAPITDDPMTLSIHMKNFGYFLGADIMAIGPVPKYAVYSHDPDGNPNDLDYPYAIMVVKKKHLPTVQATTGTDWIGTAISHGAYLPSAFIAHTMSNYIRRLGYRASPHHAGRAAGRRYGVLIPPLLLWAGIGEVSRAGIILNPFLGLELKAAAILTDMPLVPDKPIDFGLLDFCKHCKICAEHCPSNAISDGDLEMYNGYETWKLDVRRCATYNILQQYGTFCNTCVKVCPWSRPTTWPHNTVRWAAEHSGIARRAVIKADGVWRALNKNSKYEKWWFDLEYKGDHLQIPKNKDSASD
jgi:reductive dehalogenase